MTEPLVPQDPATAARLLIACIEEPHVLAALDDLEVDDFYEYPHKLVFEQVRNLQVLGEPIDIIAVDRRLQREDERLGDRAGEHPRADKCGVVYLANLLATTELYGDDLDAARADAKKLRELSQQRAAAVIGEGFAPVPMPQPATAANTFGTMPARIVGEREDRLLLAARALQYHNTYLDDCLRAILPHDLVLIGAPTGMGKTDLALSIAMQNAMKERPTAYFALEAEPLELERRTKFAWLSSAIHARSMPYRTEFNFPDWLLGNCEHIVPDELERECAEWFLSHLGALWTFYRGDKFDQHDLRKRILEIHRLVDLIIVDHLHYVDIEDNGGGDAHGLLETMKTIRDVSLRIGKPVILVAHLRKRDERLKKIVPSIDDFHGSSNITKICTQAITIERAHKVQAPKWWLSPTYISVLKDRRAGAPPYVALQFFDRRTRTYEHDYVLGRLLKGNTDWEPVKPGDQPSWARGHRQLELEFV